MRRLLDTDTGRSSVNANTGCRDQRDQIAIVSGHAVGKEAVHGCVSGNPTVALDHRCGLLLNGVRQSAAALEPINVEARSTTGVEIGRFSQRKHDAFPMVRFGGSAFTTDGGSRVRRPIVV